MISKNVRFINCKIVKFRIPPRVVSYNGVCQPFLIINLNLLELKGFKLNCERGKFQLKDTI